MALFIVPPVLLIILGLALHLSPTIITTGVVLTLIGLVLWQLLHPFPITEPLTFESVLHNWRKNDLKP